MYSLRAIFEKEPAAIAEAVRAIILALVAFGVIQVGEQQLATGLLALSIILSLLVRQAVTPKSAPTLASGTQVTVAGTGSPTTAPDTVIIAPTPPGPTGVDG